MFIDIACILLLIMAVMKGLKQGFIVAVVSFVAFLIGMAAALKLSALVADRLHSTMNLSGYWLPVLSFSLVFAAVVFGVRKGAVLVKKIAGVFLLGWLDTLLGIALYTFTYLMAFSVILFFAAQINLVSPQTRLSSTTYKYIAPLGPQVIDNMGKVVPLFKSMFTELSSYFENVANKNR